MINKIELDKIGEEINLLAITENTQRNIYMECRHAVGDYQNEVYSFPVCFGGERHEKIEELVKWIAQQDQIIKRTEHNALKASNDLKATQAKRGLLQGKYKKLMAENREAEIIESARQLGYTVIKEGK